MNKADVWIRGSIPAGVGIFSIIRNPARQVKCFG